MHDSTDDSAGDVRGRAASENAIDRSGPHGGGGERDVDAVRKLVSIRRILGHSGFMLNIPSGDRRPD